MPYISIDDFYEQVRSCSRMSREEERDCARQMKNGDPLARERLIRSYLPTVAARIRRAPAHLQTLGLVLYCQQALERAVDTFDFFQDSEPFLHRLSWALRQAVVRYMVR